MFLHLFYYWKTSVCNFYKTLFVALQIDPQNHMMTAPTEESYVTASLKVAASLPTIELMRYIRMFIKHAHYFSNSCRTGTNKTENQKSFIIIFGKSLELMALN